MRFVLNVNFFDECYPADVNPEEFWKCVAAYLDDYKGVHDLRIYTEHMANDDYYYLYFRYDDDSGSNYILGYIAIPVDNDNFGDYLPFRM